LLTFAGHAAVVWPFPRRGDWTYLATYPASFPSLSVCRTAQLRLRPIRRSNPCQVWPSACVRGFTPRPAAAHAGGPARGTLSGAKNLELMAHRPRRLPPGPDLGDAGRMLAVEAQSARRRWRWSRKCGRGRLRAGRRRSRSFAALRM